MAQVISKIVELRGLIFFPLALYIIAKEFSESPIRFVCHFIKLILANVLIFPIILVCGAVIFKKREPK